ncbi:MAG: hypothetical protein OSB70_09390 [Myxococcota bacterium]|nr:hypothetical protein [Myxococcota bacterium]
MGDDEKRYSSGVTGGVPAGDLQKSLKLGELTRMLDQRGLPGEAGRLVAEEVQDRLEGLPGDAIGLVLDGIALGIGFYDSSPTDSDALDPHVVRQLVGDFSQELGKLEEILNVLNAYLQRLGGSGGNSGVKPLQ